MVEYSGHQLYLSRLLGSQTKSLQVTRIDQKGGRSY